MTARLFSAINRWTHDRDWLVETTHPDATLCGGLVRCFIPTCNGERSLAACETWLSERGFVRNGDLPPDLFEYTL
jgi:hypothetical protein